jgi:hypothetical protein
MTKLESNMLDALEVFTTITCTKCRKHKDYHWMDSYEALEPAIEDGWYATADNVYCPDCNKKRTRKK